MPDRPPPKTRSPRRNRAGCDVPVAARPAGIRSPDCGAAETSRSPPNRRTGRSRLLPRPPVRRPGRMSRPDSEQAARRRRPRWSTLRRRSGRRSTPGPGPRLRVPPPRPGTRPESWSQQWPERIRRAGDRRPVAPGHVARRRPAWSWGEDQLRPSSPVCRPSSPVRPAPRPGPAAGRSAVACRRRRVGRPGISPARYRSANRRQRRCRGRSIPGRHPDQGFPWPPRRPGILPGTGPAPVPPRPRASCAWSSAPLECLLANFSPPVRR